MDTSCLILILMWTFLRSSRDIGWEFPVGCGKKKKTDLYKDIPIITILDYLKQCKLKYKEPIQDKKIRSTKFPKRIKSKVFTPQNHTTGITSTLTYINNKEQQQSTTDNQLNILFTDVERKHISILNIWANGTT